MSYMAMAAKYENEILEGMANSTDDDCYVPKYGLANGLVFDELLCESIEAAIMVSEKRVGKDWHLLFSAFADYLFENYGVSDVDCEFLTVMCMRQIFRAISNGLSHIQNAGVQRKLIEKMMKPDDPEPNQFDKLKGLSKEEIHRRFMNNRSTSRDKAERCTDVVNDMFRQYGLNLNEESCEKLKLLIAQII